MENTSEKWYSDGTTKVYRYTLRKDGFSDVKIRKILGQWEMLAYQNNRLDERWCKLDVDQFPEGNIAKLIKDFAVELWDDELNCYVPNLDRIG